ncbi:MAG: hypothetical protein GX575_08410 [Candidatus Anammoximicrobium sp.]|nr:hypothetical protein [Candidatus Anammoximicrobium sp.]
MQKIQCPKCGKETFDGKYCMHCQADLHPEQVAGRKKVTCPSCGKETFEARYCLYCRADMHKDIVRQEKVILKEDKAGILLKARAIHNEQQAVPIVQISVADQLPNGTLPNVKKLVVQPGTFTFVVSQMHKLVYFKPGEYDASQLALGGEVKPSLGGPAEICPVFLCTISQRPIVTTVFLPDWDALFRESGDSAVAEQGNWDVEGAIQQLSLRTADNLLGGASAQMVLRCMNPAQLLDMFIQRKLSQLDLAERGQLGLLSDEQQAALPDEQRLALGIPKTKPKQRYEGLFGKYIGVPVKALWQTVFGVQVESSPLPQTVSITMLDFYRQIRMEFAAAIIEAIRNDTAEQLYNTVELRERIAEDIQRVMSQSFEMYGLKIERVSAFRFICPKYEEVLKRRGDIALDREQLTDRKKEMDIGREQRRMAVEEARDVSTVETELQTQLASDDALLERHKLKEARETEHDRDLLRAEQLQRQLALDAEAHRAKLEMEEQQHELEMRKERRRLELQAEKMQLALGFQQQALEMQNQQQNLLLERRIKMLEQYARLPKESILTIALAENPQLAAAYSASVQAQSQQEQLQMQEKFRSELSQAYAGNNAQFTRLLQEAVKQWGQYQAAKVQERGRAQQVINVGAQGNLPPPSGSLPEEK